MSVRVYSSPRGRPRFRRVTDVVLLVAALGGLALLIAAYPPSELERSFSAFLDSFPGWLDPVWAFLDDLLWLWAIVLVLAALVARRPAVALEGIGAVLIAAAVAFVATRLATGAWPDFGSAITGASDAPAFPDVRVAEAAAVIVTVAPHLVARLRKFGHWILVLGAAGALIAGDAAPSGMLAAFLAAFAAAAAMRLALGTSAGLPEVSDVAEALRELEVTADDLEPTARQDAGVFVVAGQDSEGRRLLMKVYGSDAYDNQLFAKLWRRAMYRDGGPELGLSRGQAVEHEAFVTLLAAKAGVPTLEVVTAGKTVADDAVLVLRGSPRPFASLSADELSDDVLQRSWQTLALLGEADIAHRHINPSTLALIGGDVGLIDLGGATVAPSADQRRTDRAQLLAATAAVAGGQRAIAAAVSALGADGVASLLPYIQEAAFGRKLRQALKTAEIDPDDLRTQAAADVGTEPPELVRLRRVSLRTFLQVVLLVFATSVVISAAADVDWSELRSSVENAVWGWIALGFVVAQLPRFTQAIATLGSVPIKLPYGPVYAMQLATGYMNLALPSSLARMAVNIRFFQRQGMTPPTAIASGAIDTFASTAVQLVLVILLLLFSESTITLDLSAPSGGTSILVWIVLAMAVLTLVAVLVTPLRRAITGRVQRWWPDVRNSLASLRASHKLALLFGGNLATEVLFATALGLCARGMGYDISLADLLLINISVSLLASFIPVPGGIGVVEFGLTAGLTSAGMSSEAALAAVFFYRLSTFYIPPIWGFFALRWLERNRYL
jgi:uncharacterized membrane protein YbhN (UPF0104 family)